MATGEMFNWKKFGHDVRSYRINHKYNIQDMSVALGVSATTLRRIEEGKRVRLIHILSGLKVLNKQIGEYYQE